MSSETTKKITKCPVHPNRQLSSKGYCRDCQFNWVEPVLRGYSLQYSWAKSDYEEALLKSKQKFEAEVGKLRLEAKEANKRYLGEQK